MTLNGCADGRERRSDIDIGSPLLRDFIQSVFRRAAAIWVNYADPVKIREVDAVGD